MGAPQNPQPAPTTCRNLPPTLQIEAKRGLGLLSRRPLDDMLPSDQQQAATAWPGGGVPPSRSSGAAAGPHSRRLLG